MCRGGGGRDGGEKERGQQRQSWSEMGEWSGNRRVEVEDRLGWRRTAAEGEKRI
jgi:hypothetical protein